MLFKVLINQRRNYNCFSPIPVSFFDPTSRPLTDATIPSVVVSSWEGHGGRTTDEFRVYAFDLTKVQWELRSDKTVLFLLIIRFV